MKATIVPCQDLPHVVHKRRLAAARKIAAAPRDIAAIDCAAAVADSAVEDHHLRAAAKGYVLDHAIRAAREIMRDTPEIPVATICVTAPRPDAPAPRTEIPCHPPQSRYDVI